MTTQTQTTLNYVINYSAPPSDSRFSPCSVGDLKQELVLFRDAAPGDANTEADREAAIAVLDASEEWGLNVCGDQERGGEMQILEATDEDGRYFAFVS